jgi:hypothetical protein
MLRHFHCGDKLRYPWRMQPVWTFLASEWQEMRQSTHPQSQRWRVIFRLFLWAVVLAMTLIAVLLLVDSLYMSRHREFAVFLIIGLMSASGWFLLVWRVGAPQFKSMDTTS